MSILTPAGRRLAAAPRAIPLADMSRLLACACLAAVLLGGCGSTPSPTSTPPPTPRPTPTATPTLPPDVDHVDVTNQGVGTYQLITVPVAILRNDATRT